MVEEAARRSRDPQRTAAGHRTMPDQAKRPRDRDARRHRKYVYFFGNGKADGDRTMKDLLGGKGANLAEMTNAGLPVPARLHDHHRRLHALLPAEAQDARRRSTREMVDNLAQARKGRRREVRRREEPAARVGALGRQVLDARHDGHDPEPRA